jgi:hypothetical protein
MAEILYNVTDSKNNEIKLKTVNISPEIRSESNQFYSNAFDKALADGYKLRLECEKLLEQRGLLDTALQDKQIEDLRAKIKKHEIELRSARINGRRLSKDEGFKLALQIRKLRKELNGVGAGLSDFFKNSAESIADNERFQYLIYACTIRQDTGERYWGSYDEMKNESEQAIYTAAINSFVKLSMGVEQDLENPFYENQWLQRMGYANKKGELVDSKGRLIDENGRLVNSEGYFVNEEGKRVDIYGNLVDDKGNLLVEDGWEVMGKTEVAEAASSKVPIASPTL